MTGLTLCTTRPILTGICLPTSRTSTTRTRLLCMWRAAPLDTIASVTLSGLQHARLAPSETLQGPPNLQTVLFVPWATTAPSPLSSLLSALLDPTAARLGLGSQQTVLLVTLGSTVFWALSLPRHAPLAHTGPPLGPQAWQTAWPAPWASSAVREPPRPRRAQRARSGTLCQASRRTTVSRALQATIVLSSQSRPPIALLEHLATQAVQQSYPNAIPARQASSARWPPQARPNVQLEPTGILWAPLLRKIVPPAPAETTVSKVL